MRCGRADIVDSWCIEKGYIHANGQIVGGHEGGATAARRFYLHDRLGSVRQIIGAAGAVVKYATYEPFGEAVESGGSLADPFGFTGQYYDCEIAQYHLRARQYDPHISRFTSRDPVFGKFEEPLTLHKYLYCGNNPLNGADPRGLWTVHFTGTAMASLGWSGLRQSGIAIDDKGNWAWINISGGGAGMPVASAGLSIGFTTANTVGDLAGWAWSTGSSVSIPKVPLLSGGVDYISGQGFWGLQVTVSGSIPHYIPWEYHWHFAHSKVYEFDFDMLREMFAGMLEEAVYDVKTLGQWYALALPYGFLETIP